ncbi:hypothetical protein [Pseudoalteromonas sp.]|uniref:hypothetical protein n=1 Tax=Pseudoalteromonas sp. TaxID=53249 RepID=UPI003565B46E
MSIKIKRQSLMGDSKNKKKVKQRATQQVTAQRQTSTVANQQATSQSYAKTKASKSKKVVWITIAFVAFAALIIPKPQMISYQKLNVVGTSIYWPGFLGLPATILDSDLTLAGDIEQGKIYLCDNINQNVGCHKYQIVKQEGFISVISHLISD